MELHNFTKLKLGEENLKIKLCAHRVHNTMKCAKEYLI